MNNTNFPQFVLLFVLFMASLTVTSQDTKNAIILYNSKAVEAEITSDGNVNKIISEQPDYLKGFTLKVQDYGQFIASESTKVEKQPASSQAYSIFSSDYKLVKFEQNHATLSDEAINLLEEIVLHLRNAKGENVVLVSLSTLESGLITKNRLNSIRSYFKIRGIDPERVKIESLHGEIDVNEIKIHFLK